MSPRSADPFQPVVGLDVDVEWDDTQEMQAAPDTGRGGGTPRVAPARGAEAWQRTRGWLSEDV